MHISPDGKETPTERNSYFPGKLLTARDLKAEQRYGIVKRRLMSRALFGWGVVHGLQVSAKESDGAARPGHVWVGPGFALDRHGGELLLSGPSRLHLDTLFRNEPALAEGQWELRAHYAECPREPVQSGEACSCDDPEWNRVRETVIFALHRRAAPWVPPNSCAEPPPWPNDADHKRGWLQDFACEVLGDLPDAEQIGSEHNLRCRWQGCRLDPDAGVTLAVLILSGDPACPEVQVLDACQVRRFAWRNDLLFRMIAGQQDALTRIAWVNWHETTTPQEPRAQRQWHLRLDPAVPYDDFRDLFIGTLHRGPGGSPPEGLEIGFTGPVLADTLNEASILVTYVFPERAEHVDDVRRIRLEFEPFHQTGDPSGTARRVRVQPTKPFLEGELVDTRSYLDKGALVEIEMRGDLIRDCRGRALDAEPIDFPAAPTGNGVPGGTFLSVFRVDARQPWRRNLDGPPAQQARSEQS